MPRNGSGTYSLPAGNPVVTGTTITSTWGNTTLADIAQALSSSVAKDGQTAMSGDLPMGDQTIKNLGLGTVNLPAVRFNGDPNTGVYSSGADSVGLVTGGVEVLRATATTGLDITGTISNFDLTPTTPNARHEVATTTAGGYNSGAGRFVLQFNWESVDFFSQCPNAHFAVVTRCDTSLLATAIFGHGIGIGNLSGASEGTQINPGIQIETWHNGYGADNRLFPNTGLNAAKPLEDNVPYRTEIISTVTGLGTKYIRYKLFRYNAVKSQWDLERDTGDVLDVNSWADFTKTGVSFGYAFTGGATGWTVSFTALSTSWGPATTQTPQIPTTAFLGEDLSDDFDTVQNTGGAQALNYIQSVTFNYENLTGVGQISTWLSGQGVFTANEQAALETLMRPIFCHLSMMFDAMRNRGIIPPE